LTLAVGGGAAVTSHEQVMKFAARLRLKLVVDIQGKLNAGGGGCDHVRAPFEPGGIWCFGNTEAPAHGLPGFQLSRFAEMAGRD